MTEDCDRKNTFVHIVEFPSREAALANSALPETASLSQQMAQYCDGPIVFRNLDVHRVDEM
jgi:hypothetical protein